MYYLPEFFALYSLNLLNLISPGVETATMIRNSLISRKVGLATGAGIVLSGIIHRTYTVLGFGLFISKNPWLYSIIKYSGSAYLVFLGIKCFLSLRKKNKKGQTIEVPSVVDLTPRQAFRMGFFMDLLNPQASICFMSIVSATISPETPLHIQGLYAGSLVLTSATWYTLQACLFSSRYVKGYVPHLPAWFNYLTGVLMISVGIRMFVL